MFNKAFIIVEQKKIKKFSSSLKLKLILKCIYHEA